MAFWKRKHKHNDKSVKKRRDLRLILELYPISIWESRYGGVYEGGRWIAIGNCDLLPQYTDIMGDDESCMRFWNSRQSEKIGRGETPNDALADLLERNRDLGDLIDSFYSTEWDVGDYPNN